MIKFQDLLAEKLIPVPGLVARFQSAARLAGQDYSPIHGVKSAGVAISLVQAGMGVTVQPECLIGINLFDRIAAIELAEPWARRIISIATPRGRVLSSSANMLVQHLIKNQSS